MYAQTQKPPLETNTEPRNITYCELAKDPGAYNHELLRMTAFVNHGFEDFTLTEPNCSVPSQGFSIWLMYGGKIESSTPYCCPGEADAGERTESLVVEDVAVPLIADEAFRQFRDILRKEPDTTVRATIEGRFFSGEKLKINGPEFWGGFGHMGCCSLFVIQHVVSSEPHTRSDVDYTAEAGWYEKEGCRSSSLTYVRHISVSFSEAQASEAIEEQRLADEGTNSWAFNNPIRVAKVSLKPFYKDQAPVLHLVKQTPVRQVFRWKNGKKSITVVVTRPYWLSYYSKSDQVAWVATTIKEADCI